MAKKNQIGYKPTDSAYTKDIDAWFIIVLLIFFFPVGLWLMWTRTSWKKWVKVLVTLLIALLFLSNAVQVFRDIQATKAAETGIETTAVI